MHQLPPLIVDLALILAVAGVVTVLFRKIRQPLVLGYVLAGVVVGSKSRWWPTISDIPNVRVWADIGVIFLLFGLGLEFSFKKLLRIGSAASITAFVEVSGMLLIAYATGRLFGWTQMDSLFLGGILAISSTTIIIRAFEELGVKGRRFVDLVFGVLIVEDLVAVLILVLLSTVALRNRFEGIAMAYSTVKLGFFLVIWFLSGIFLIPSFLRYFRRSLNEETLLLVALGLCFVMVVSAAHAGFSPALGAFLMGSILGETTEAEKIEALIKPVKNLFAAIFFVSVGMLIDVKVLIEHSGEVLLISGILILGKTLHVVLGALLAGQGLRHAVQAGFSLAQIGEFSFIIAGLGESLNVTSKFLYPLAVGVSAVTTFSTPYAMRSSEFVYTWLEKHLPAGWRQRIERYEASMRSISLSGNWTRLLRSYFVRLLFNGIIVVGIFALSTRLLPPLLSPWLGEAGAQWLVLLGSLAPAAPFLWAMAVGRPKHPDLLAVLSNRRYRAPVMLLEGLRIIVTFAVLGFLAPKLISFRATLVIAASVAVLVLLVFSRYLNAVYTWIERHFLLNLSQREREAPLKAEAPVLVPWDGHLASFTVDPDSTLIGKALIELKIRESFGVIIAMIERGHKKIPAPGRSEKIYPFDKVFAIGSEEELMRFKAALEIPDKALEDSEPAPHFTLQPLELAPSSPYCQKTIKDSGLREATSGLVVGIERHGRRIVNPDALTVLEAGDMLWVVGDSQRIQLIKQKSAALS